MKLDDDFEEWDTEEEEAEEAVKPSARVFVFLGMVVVAAIFTIILWNVTHGGRKDDNRNSHAVEQTGESGSEMNSDGSLDPGSETASGGSVDPDSAAETGASLDPGSAASGESMDPGAEMVSGESTDPGSAASGESMDPGAEAASGEGENPDSGMASGAAGASGEGGQAPASNNAGSNGNEENGVMAFAECQDTVTPKEVINLRSAPSTGQEENIVTQAVNGEILNRTGINSDTGWSRLEYNGRTLYAVSRYLTTDLTYQPSVAEPDPNVVSTKDGRTITFTDCDDNISPKEYVNLRLEPSTSEGDATVHCRLDYGMVVHRTGISEAFGWSRVEYDNHVLYVVTSYMYVVEDQ